MGAMAATSPVIPDERSEDPGPVSADANQWKNTGCGFGCAAPE